MRGDRRELRTDEQPQACDICGRTILKGERTEVYLAPGGHRRLVCELCVPRADHEGWIRESAAGELPATRARPAPRRSLLSRLGLGGGGGQRQEPVASEPSGQQAPREPGNGRPEREREARHIRAIPTTAEVKVERALELFNGSDHPRTIAGIARSLGPAWVYVGPAATPSEVDIVIAWELSWYRYKVDLGDATEPIVLLEKGDELAEVGEELRNWNGAIDEDGRLSTDVGSPR